MCKGRGTIIIIRWISYHLTPPPTIPHKPQADRPHRMRLLSHNMLRNTAKDAIEGFPLKIEATEVDVSTNRIEGCAYVDITSKQSGSVRVDGWSDAVVRSVGPITQATTSWTIERHAGRRREPQ